MGLLWGEGAISSVFLPGLLVEEDFSVMEIRIFSGD
jgi:hypothetical protein